jgi:endonuclease/exonuclease/phosphatase family metal-dependent hydrolase
MQKLSWFNKIIFWLNVIVIFLTLMGYVLPFLAPKIFPVLAVLTLFLPVFLVVNILFFVYWMVQLKKQMIGSGLVLLLGFSFIGKFYKMSETEIDASERDFTVMSYNVRLFDLFHWQQKEGVKQTILDFINEQNPDILCIQEYSENARVDLRVYKHKAIFMLGNKIKTGQAIFSKFPIIDQGNLRLPHSDNNIIYADVRKGKDTLRVYNMHLESIRISPDVNELAEDVNQIDRSKSERLLQRLSKGFSKQQVQAELLEQHKSHCPYPMLICGDMNNSPFSYVYQHIKGSMKDCFVEAGHGFGQTYRFKYYPARIDYIFADQSMSVKTFTYFPDFVYSDHYPIMTRLEMKP